MTSEEIDNRIITSIIHFRSLEKRTPNSPMICEIKQQFEQMSQGGDGGSLGFVKNGRSTCRETYYSGLPDFFFDEVRSLMGWK